MNEELWQKIQTGDGLTDSELTEAYIWFRDLADDLELLGPIFHLAWKEAHFRRRDLKGFMEARGLA